MIAVQLIGKGAVGSALLRQLAASFETSPRRDPDMRVTGIAGKDRAVFRPQGFGAAALLALGEGRMRLEDLPDAVMHGGWEDITARSRAAGTPMTIMVDMTAEANATVHAAWLREGLRVVTANKHPLAGPSAVAGSLVSHARYRAETTVGAGLPVLRILDDLLATGDRIEAIEGMLSGTLGFILSACEEGASFDDALRAAAARGFTEPDPLEDLSGMDVARKALILGRKIGWKGELSDIAVERLDPDAMDARLHAAGTRRKKLRYLASVTPRSVTVGLREVGDGDPFAGLRGPENMVLFRTSRYRDVPLTVRGPGAGTEVTAAGVFADILDVCRSSAHETLSSTAI